MFLTLIIFLAAYLLGSIPFGLILTQLAGKGDIRKIGSGNIGATNVLRTGSKWLAALTLLLDGGKGFLAVWLASTLVTPVVDPMAHDRTMFCALLGVLIGHLYPVWLKYKGGKGVATALGIYFALDWRIGVTACATWLLVAVLFRYSSLAALVALLAAIVPPGIRFFAPGWQFRDSDIPNHAFDLIFDTFLIALIVILRHHANIRRLLAGTEPKIGKTNAAA